MEVVRKHGSEIVNLKKSHGKKMDHRKQLEALKYNLNDPEWRSRCLYVEIHDVPTADVENVMMTVSEVVQSLDLPALQTNDIVTLHTTVKNPIKFRESLYGFYNKEHEMSSSEMKRD